MGCTINAATYGNQLTAGADQDVCHPSSDLLVSSGAESGDSCLQQDPVLDHFLREEQQRKLTSGGERYKAMQVCLTINKTQF